MFGEICLIVMTLFSSIYGGIDADYYYNSGLRTQNLMCKNKLKQAQCVIECGFKSPLCIQDECHCISIISANQKITVPYKELDSLYALRPTVRHHIAHFCPNLDIARDCIRKCMEIGKPAFCGKNHVCYCGHKYVNTVKGQDGDTKEIYAQFKDMYAKYFGPLHRPQTLK